MKTEHGSGYLFAAALGLALAARMRQEKTRGKSSPRHRDSPAAVPRVRRRLTQPRLPSSSACENSMRRSQRPPD